MYDEIVKLIEESTKVEDISKLFVRLKQAVEDGEIDNIQDRELIKKLKKRKAMIKQGLV